MSNKQLLHLFLATLSGIALTLVFLWLSTATPAQADPGTRYVAMDGNDAYPCESVVHRCRTIQRAIDVADPNDEIRVAGGTYSRAGTVVVITKPLRISGCYGLDFTAPDPDLYQTVLDAQWGGSVISITNADDVVLMHLTLTHGDGTGNCGTYGCGGGIYVKDASLHVGHSIITDNVGSLTGGGSGGGVYVENNRLVEIWRSTIVSNTANTDVASSNNGLGGGIYINGGTVRLVENQVLSNTANISTSGFGGGIHLSSAAYAEVLTNVIRSNKANVNAVYGSYGGGLYGNGALMATVANNEIEDNLANGTGGGVEVAYSNAHLTRNRIINNTAAGGGAVFIQSTTPVTLSNNLIAHNYAGFRCGGVYASLTSLPGSQVVLVNNTIADNGDIGVADWTSAVLTMTNNLIAGHAVGISIRNPASSTVSADTNLFWNISDPIIGTHAILEDPLLAPNYHLRSGSPAADQGVTVPWLTTDLEGNPRPQGSEYDIGAFEGEEVWWNAFLPLTLCNYTPAGVAGR